jgi:transcriptional regulator with XRE-family HTH domain
LDRIKLKQIIGANIRKLRKVAGLKQEELAGLLECSRSNLAQIEIGKNSATLIFVYKVVAIFGCSVFDILPEKIPNTEKTESKGYLNTLRDEAFAYAEKQGFHKRKMNLGERLMLVVSELSEMLEADRNGKRAPVELFYPKTNETRPIADMEITKETYEAYIRGTLEEELADAVIRLADIAGIYGMNLDWHVSAKMAYNRTRPYMHGKKYG